MARPPALKPADLPAASQEISALVQAKIGPKGPDLRFQARKAGRRLPRGVRQDLHVIAGAMDLALHPKLSRQIDQAVLGEAVARVKAHLSEIDVADRRWGVLLSWLVDNVVNLLLLVIVVVSLLVWRGLV